MMRGAVDSFGLTDIGCVRETNQDQFLIADLCKTAVIQHTSLGFGNQCEWLGAPRAKLMMVADGMGGHTGGERASCMAVEGIVQYLLTNLHWPLYCSANHEHRFFEGLKSALEFSQSQIRSVAQVIPEQGKMGTTLTMGWVVWPYIYLIHVGDSRAYLFRDNQLRLLSHDQTFAQALADNGLIPHSAVESHRYSHVLISALGCSAQMEPLYGKTELQFGDQLLMCTDGLTGQVAEAEIGDILSRGDSAEACCRELVQRAKQSGGRDNITVTLSRFFDDQIEPQSDCECESIDRECVESETAVLRVEFE